MTIIFHLFISIYSNLNILAKTSVSRIKQFTKSRNADDNLAKTSEFLLSIVSSRSFTRINPNSFRIPL